MTEQTDRAGVRIAPTADVADSAEIGPGSAIWHLAQIREGAVLGESVGVGRGAYVGPEVRIGDNCKLQNYALVYEPAVLEAGVFVGPAAVFTNDHYPRAVNPDGSFKSGHDWTPVGVTCLEGASIGARAVCVAPVTIGRWALVAAGSTVIRDVPDFALVVGSPARRIGWVGRAGVPLRPGETPDEWVCPQTGAMYRQTAEDLLEEL
ncbi:MAG: acyltransferase [Candidatus Nanopelagicales bacterium]